MKKQYIKPTLQAIEICNENVLLAASNEEVATYGGNATAGEWGE